MQGPDRVEVGADCPVALSRGFERELPRGYECGQGRIGGCGGYCLGVLGCAGPLPMLVTDMVSSRRPV